MRWLFVVFLAGCGAKTVLHPKHADWHTPPETAYTSTPTGLRYVDLVPGGGAEALDGATVHVHYDGWLIDGTPFDSSRDRGTPLEFQLGAGRVIPGWEEGVLGMKIGGVRQLVIPPELGYGDRDLGMIPPGSTLVFEVELLAVGE